MKDLSEVKQKLIKDLIENKKFHQLEFEVNSLLLEKRSSFLLNLLGVCKISKIPTSKDDLNESFDLFKEAYSKAIASPYLRLDVSYMHWKRKGVRFPVVHAPISKEYRSPRQDVRLSLSDTDDYVVAICYLWTT